MKSAGYRVSTNGGQPCRTTANGSSSCVTSKQGEKTTKASSDETKGKPSGSNEVGVYRTRGRPMASTEAKGCRVGKSGGRPTGSTEANGFDASKADGRPIGTTKVKGFGLARVGACMPVLSLVCYLRMMWNSQISGIPTVKLLMLMTVV